MKVYSNEPFYLSFNIMLMTLYLLQVYWFTFIVRLLIKLIIKGGEVEDTREFSENEVKKKEL
uniref:TLC domain-containing protein n=1 Tax=Amphimedon queenslandica TaxID=400682 RepID=A0A1X7SDN3_AMPQE